MKEAYMNIVQQNIAEVDLVVDQCKKSISELIGQRIRKIIYKAIASISITMNISGRYSNFRLISHSLHRGRNHW